MVSHIFLASKSPRRQQLVGQLGLAMEVVALDVDESIAPDTPAEQVAELLAQRKAAAFDLQKLTEGQALVTADTVVVCDNRVLGKPHSHQEAYDMLRMLSDKCHFVYTGVCIRSQALTYSFTECTKVFFKELDDDTINYYIDNYQPYDKAGSYGIQEWIGMVGISHIEGCYYNVMGLPVARLYEVLRTRF